MTTSCRISVISTILMTLQFAVLTHIATSKILSALLLQLYAYSLCKGDFRVLYHNVCISYPKVGEFLLRYMLQHVPALLYKIYLLNEHMNLCTMWYVTCCNNVEIHTTGFLTGFLQVFYWFFTLVNQLVSIQVFW